MSKVILMPLSLISLVAVLPDWHSIILDGNLCSEEECFRSIENDLHDVICVGISALSGPEISSGLRFAAMVRSRVPTVPIIWGGWHVSCLPEESLRNPYVDAVVIGPGQKAFPEIVRRIEHGERYHDIPGVMTIAKDGAMRGSLPREPVDLSSCPPPAFERLHLERYRQESIFILPYPAIDGTKLTGYLYYVTSFGCPYACGFCSNAAVYRQRWSGYSIDAVLNQLEWLVRAKGFNCVAIIDAEFFFQHDRVEHFCNEVIARDLRFVWDAQASVKSILRLEDKGLLPKLRQAGCWHANVGAESGSAEMLRYMNKGIRVEDTLRCAQALKNCGIVGSFNFLFGLPPEKESHLYESFTLAYQLKNIDPDSPLPVSFYSPLPGNAIFDDAIKAGFRAPANLEEWGRYNPSYASLAEHVPWRRPEWEKLVYDVITFYLPMGVPGNLMRGTITMFKQKLKQSPYRMVLRLASKLAEYRMRHHQFRFRFERIIFDLYWKLLRKPAYSSGRWNVGANPQTQKEGEL